MRVMDDWNIARRRNLTRLRQTIEVADNRMTDVARRHSKDDDVANARGDDANARMANIVAAITRPTNRA
jgi:hypothetical protein